MNPSQRPDPSSLERALERDAARITEPPFDLRLHAETMGRLRTLESSRPAVLVWRWAFIGAGPAAAALALFFANTESAFRSEPRHPVHPGLEASLPKTTRAAPSPSAAPATYWRYHRAALQSDAALLAALDEDSLTLLPPSSPAFSNPRTL
jgi:hypothetical protein